MKIKKAEKVSSSSPSTMSAKPHYGTINQGNFSLDSVRGFRLWAVVIETYRGAVVHSVVNHPRKARAIVDELCHPRPFIDSNGIVCFNPSYNCQIVPLEIPRHYFGKGL